MKSLRIGQECFADIGGHLVEARVTERREFDESDFEMYAVEWTPRDSAETVTEKSLLRSDLFPTLEEARQHTLDRLSYWESQLEKIERAIEAAQEEQSEAERIEAEEQFAEDRDDDSAMRLEREAA